MLDRVFQSSDSLRVAFWMATRDRGGVMASHVDLLDTSGTAIARRAVQLAPTDRHAIVDLPLAAVPPGPYRLRVSITSASGTATRDVGIAVR